MIKLKLEHKNIVISLSKSVITVLILYLSASIINSFIQARSTFKQNEKHLESNIVFIKREYEKKCEEIKKVINSLSCYINKKDNIPYQIQKFYSLYNDYLREKGISFAGLEFYDYENKNKYNIKGPILNYDKLIEDRNTNKFLNFKAVCKDRNNQPIGVLTYTISPSEVVKDPKTLSHYKFSFNKTNPFEKQYGEVEPGPYVMAGLKNNFWDLVKENILNNLSNNLIITVFFIALFCTYKVYLNTTLYKIASNIPSLEKNSFFLEIKVIDYWFKEKEKLEEDILNRRHELDQREDRVNLFMEEYKRLQIGCEIFKSSQAEQIKFIMEGINRTESDLDVIAESSKIMMSILTGEKQFKDGNTKQARLMAAISLKSNAILEGTNVQPLNIKKLNLKRLVSRAITMLGYEIHQKMITVDYENLNKDFTFESEEWVIVLLILWCLRESLILTLSTQSIQINARKNNKLGTISLSFYQQGINLSVEELKNMKSLLLNNKKSSTNFWAFCIKSEHQLDLFKKALGIREKYILEKQSVKGIELEIPIDFPKVDRMGDRSNESNVYKIY